MNKKGLHVVTILAETPYRLFTRSDNIKVFWVNYNFRKMTLDIQKLYQSGKILSSKLTCFLWQLPFQVFMWCKIILWPHNCGITSSWTQEAGLCVLMRSRFVVLIVYIINSDWGCVVNNRRFTSSVALQHIIKDTQNINIWHECLALYSAVNKLSRGYMWSEWIIKEKWN